MNTILAILLMFGAIFILATLFNVATYLLFVFLELVGAAVRLIIRRGGYDR